MAADDEGEDRERRILRACAAVSAVVLLPAAVGLFVSAVSTGELYFQIGFAGMVVVVGMAVALLRSTRAAGHRHGGGAG